MNVKPKSLVYPCMLVSFSYTPARERRGSGIYRCGALTAQFSDSELLCYLEDGLLDPEGGQQNWWRTLSFLPMSGKKREIEEYKVINKHCYANRAFKNNTDHLWLIELGFKLLDIDKQNKFYKDS